MKRLPFLMLFFVPLTHAADTDVDQASLTDKSCFVTGAPPIIPILPNVGVCGKVTLKFADKYCGCCALSQPAEKPTTEKSTLNSGEVTQLINHSLNAAFTDRSSGKSLVVKADKQNPNSEDSKKYLKDAEADFLKKFIKSDGTTSDDVRNKINAIKNKKVCAYGTTVKVIDPLVEQNNNDSKYYAYAQRESISSKAFPTLAELGQPQKNILEKIKQNQSLDPEDKTQNTFDVCSEPEIIHSHIGDAIPQNGGFSLPKDLYFANNQSTLSAAKQKRLENDLIQLFLDQYNQNHCPLDISQLDFTSSCNLKANGGSVGRWDFKALAQSRAEYLKKIALEVIKSPELKGKVNFTETKDNIGINSDGENGDGTSGPCPYQIKNPNAIPYEIIPNPVVWNSKSMEESKYSKVGFSGTTNCPVNNHTADKPSAPGKGADPSEYHYASKCLTVTVDCITHK